MKLSPVGFGAGAALIWGGAIFVIGGINAAVPGYGEPVLALVVSLYPGYDASGTLGDLLLGTAYAVFDGFAAGFVFALLHNAVAHLTARPAERGRSVGTPVDDAASATPTAPDEATETVPDGAAETAPDATTPSPPATRD